MTPQEFTKSMVYLGQAYGKEFGEEQTGVWYSFFSKEEPEVFQTAIVRLIPKCKFMPSIAEIKEEIAELTAPDLRLKPEEEWDKVQRAIRRYGVYNAEEAEKSLDPYTRSVVKHMGGFKAICLMPDDDWPRKNFMSLWKEMKEAGVNVRVIEESLLTADELLHLSMVKTIPKIIENKDPEEEPEKAGRSSFDEALEKIRRMYNDKRGRDS